MSDTLNLTIIPDRSYTLSLLYKNDDGTLFDWTNWNVKMQFRRNVGETGIPLYEATVGNGLTLDTVNSVVTIDIDQATTVKFTYDMVYDISIFATDASQTIIEGQVNLQSGVTIL